MISGVVVKTADALDVTDHLAVDDPLRDPVERIAEEVLGDPHDDVFVARRVAHFLGLLEQVRHAGFDQMVNSVI